MKKENHLKDIKTLEVEILKSKPKFAELDAGHFFMIPNSTIPALRKLKLGAGDITVYMFMLSLANGYEGSICYPSTKTFQKVLGLSRTQVMTSKKRLEELGLITLVRKGGNSWGEKKANEYKELTI